jgi:hypothetical protein
VVLGADPSVGPFTRHYRRDILPIKMTLVRDALPNTLNTLALVWHAVWNDALAAVLCTELEL